MNVMALTTTAPRPHDRRELVVEHTNRWAWRPTIDAARCHHLVPSTRKAAGG